jgi:hypothetical protein
MRAVVLRLSQVRLSLFWTIGSSPARYSRRTLCALAGKGKPMRVFSWIGSGLVGSLMFVLTSQAVAGDKPATAQTQGILPRVVMAVGRDGRQSRRIQ